MAAVAGADTSLAVGDADREMAESPAEGSENMTVLVGWEGDGDGGGGRDVASSCRRGRLGIAIGDCGFGVRFSLSLTRKMDDDDDDDSNGK